MFRTVYFSNEIGLKKPDAEIFHFVLGREKQRPENCLFVDDREENIRVAAELGINALLYQDTDRFLECIKTL
jgi:putative hydrolase of the HAD superfamily